MKQDKLITKTVDAEKRLLNYDSLITLNSLLEGESVNEMLLINKSLNDELDKLSELTGKTKSQIVNEALLFEIAILKRNIKEQEKYSKYLSKPLGDTTIMKGMHEEEVEKTIRYLVENAKEVSGKFQVKIGAEERKKNPFLNNLEPHEMMNLTVSVEDGKRFSFVKVIISIHNDYEYFINPDAIELVKSQSPNLDFCPYIR